MLKELLKNTKLMSKVYGIIKENEDELLDAVLFGSLIKLETKEDSDIDLSIFTKLKKKINTDVYEKKLNRNMQLFKFDSLSGIKNKELKHNILNGYALQGEIKWWIGKNVKIENLLKASR